MKAAVKRVYTSVGVRALAENAKLFAVTLDGRDLRTPARKVLELPTKELALGVALEWEAQREHIRPETMPLMKLATTTVDQVPSIRSTMIDSMLRCLQSDLTCFRSSDEPALMAKEEAAYAPIIAWTADTLQLKLNVTDSMVLTHPSEALPRAEALLAEADDWCVAPRHSRHLQLSTHAHTCTQVSANACEKIPSVPRMLHVVADAVVRVRPSQGDCCAGHDLGHVQIAGSRAGADKIAHQRRRVHHARARGRAAPDRRVGARRGRARPRRRRPRRARRRKLGLLANDWEVEVEALSAAPCCCSFLGAVVAGAAPLYGPLEVNGHSTTTVQYPIFVIAIHQRGAPHLIALAPRRRRWRRGPGGCRAALSWPPPACGSFFSVCSRSSRRRSYLRQHLHQS